MLDWVFYSTRRDRYLRGAMGSDMHKFHYRLGWSVHIGGLSHNTLWMRYDPVEDPRDPYLLYNIYGPGGFNYTRTSLQLIGNYLDDYFARVRPIDQILLVPPLSDELRVADFKEAIEWERMYSMIRAEG